jgi:hypothetical protein
VRKIAYLAQGCACLALFVAPAACRIALAQAALAGAPAAEQSPVRPADRPQLALIGTVVGTGEGYAVFVNESTRAIVLLKAGEGHGGWTLRSIKSREVVLQRNDRMISLHLLEQYDEKATLSSQSAFADRVPTAFKTPPNLRPATQAYPR